MSAAAIGFEPLARGVAGISFLLTGGAGVPAVDSDVGCWRR